MKPNNQTSIQEHPLEALSETYIHSKDFSPATVKTYRIAYQKFIQYLKGSEIIYAKTSDVIRFREHQRDLGQSSFYIHIQISALKGLYRYLKVNQIKLSLPEVYAYDIMVAIKSEKIQHKIGKPVLTLEEAKQLIMRTKEMRKTIHQYRNHAIISLMLTSGLSVHDIVHARLSDYQLEEGVPILYLNRRNREDKDRVKISKGTAIAIDDYLKRRKDSNLHLFHGHKADRNQCLNRMFFYTMFQALLKDTGLAYTGITAHSLRHTAALFNLERGASIEETKAFLRHSNILTTLVYQTYIARMKDDSEYQIDAMILKEDALEMAFIEYLIYEKTA